MLKIPGINSLLDSFRTASSKERLHYALDVTTRILEFTHFAMGYHIDLLRPPEDTISLSTYNADWVFNGHFSDDWIHAASTRTVIGVLWHDVGNLIRLNVRHKRILAEAAAFGFGAGCTVPVHLPWCLIGVPTRWDRRGD